MQEKEMTLELTDGKASLDLSKVYIAKYKKRKKRKKYKYYYCYKSPLMNVFIEALIQGKKPKKKTIGLINPKTGRFRNVKK